MNAAQFWTLNALAVVALVLATINITYFQSNREARTQVAERQQFINQTARLNQLNVEVVKALARVAVEENDAAIGDLLQRAGISYRVRAAEDSAGAAPAATTTD